VVLIYVSRGFGGSNWQVAIPVVFGILACIIVIILLLVKVGNRIYSSKVIVARYHRETGPPPRQSSPPDSPSEWLVTLYVGPARSDDWRNGKVSGRTVTRIRPDPVWSAATEELADRLRSKPSERPHS
jgi:hypothetical protein